MKQPDAGPPDEAMALKEAITDTLRISAATLQILADRVMQDRIGATMLQDLTAQVAQGLERYRRRWPRPEGTVQALALKYARLERDDAETDFNNLVHQLVQALVLDPATPTREIPRQARISHRAAEIFGARLTVTVGVGPVLSVLQALREDPERSATDLTAILCGITPFSAARGEGNAPTGENAPSQADPAGPLGGKGERGTET